MVGDKSKTSVIDEVVFDASEKFESDLD
jgi:hypothetical protein